MRKHIARLIGCLLLLVGTSCQQDNPRAYQVDAAFEPYVQQFLATAKQYNKDFDDLGLVMRFADLPQGVAGRCYPQRIPIYIEIDPTYWNQLSGATVNDVKEDLVFHEMAHGYPPKRGHKNTVFPNGDWGSIMRGDSLPDNRSSNLNYRGMRKPYYIEELFTETSNVPAWSTFKPDSVFGAETVLVDASAAQPQYWYITDNRMFKGSIEGEEYHCQNKSTASLFLPICFSGYDVTHDFCIELTIRRVEGEEKAGFGPALGDTTSTHISVHYLKAGDNQHALIGESGCTVPFIDLYLSDWKSNENNVLSIRKQKNLLYYYLNGKFFYHNDLDGLPLSGRCFGAVIPAQTTVAISRLILKVPASAPKAQRTYETTPIQPVVLPHILSGYVY